MNVEGNFNFLVGTGAFEDFTNGTPQPSSFFGQAGWWTVPTSWYTKSVDGVIYVSPNSDFSTPTYVAKMNNDYTLVFQNAMANLLERVAGSGVQAVVGAPTQVNVIEAPLSIIDGNMPGNNILDGNG